MCKRSHYGDEAETPDLLYKSATCSCCLWSGTLRPPVPSYRADPALPSGHTGAEKEEVQAGLSPCAISTGTAFRAAEGEHSPLALWLQLWAQTGGEPSGAGDGLHPDT